MKRSQLPPNKTATYVLPRWKTVYVSVPKAACTSLKWLVADLQGESPERFYNTMSRETGRSMTVHHRYRWKRTPMLNDLSEAELDEIRPDNGWFVFAVVRHPSARLWSGWQSKFLLGEPRFKTMFPEAPWPRVPQSTREVVEEFRSFVRAMDQERHRSLFQDRHFRSQSELLHVNETPYSRIYRTAEMGQLLQDLADHVRPLGLEAVPPLHRSNETPLPPIRALFDDPTLEVIGRHYAADFANFGFEDVLPGGLAEQDEYSQEAFAEIGRLVERAERINDLYEATVRAKAARRAAQSEVARLRTQLAAAQNATPSPRSTSRQQLGRLKQRALGRLRPGPTA
jgi:hypothetical protein